MDISSDAIKTRSIKYLLAQQIQKSILYVTFRDMIITSVLCDVILYICNQLNDDDVCTMLNNFSCYCCCVDFRISTYRELSPGGLWTLMSTDRAGQIWPLLFVRPLSPTPQSIQNNRPHSSNFVIMLLGNWWKLLCFEAKKRFVNCILQKINLEYDLNNLFHFSNYVTSFLILISFAIKPLKWHGSS